MKARLVGIVTGLTLLAPALALAAPPVEGAGRQQGDRMDSERISRTMSGAEATNANLRAQAESKYQRDGRVKARSQVIGTLVEQKGKVMYVRVDSGAVVPIDGALLQFKGAANAGDELRATFIVTDDLKNVATALERAVPASTGAAGG
jgi:hypothetical protein